MRMDERTIRRTYRGLLKEAEDLEREAEKRRVAARHLEDLLPESERPQNGRSAVAATNGQPLTASEAILTVMREAGRSMSLDDIRQAVERKGWKVPKSLHETMRRLKVAEKIERVGFSTYQ